jgi:cyclic pyranopterin monophosphate synthase
MPARLSHTDARGQVRMVDVGAKPETHREAVASAAVRMSRATLALALGGAATRGSRAGRSVARTTPGSPKGDVLATARVAAIAALKRTAEWIPLCHPVRLVGTDVQIEGDARLPGIRVRVTARAFDRTGVEMEAMVGAAAAALTIYDMVKAAERGVEVLSVRLEEKSGGRSGTWRRGDATPRAVRKGTAATRTPVPTSNSATKGTKKTW